MITAMRQAEFERLPGGNHRRQGEPDLRRLRAARRQEMEAPEPSAETMHGQTSGQVPPGADDTGFLPPSPPRAGVESIVVRCIATAGIVGIGTAIGAILIAANVAGWISGLVVSLVSVILAALLWRSRRL
jgi:hypothetical protein